MAAKLSRTKCLPNLLKKTSILRHKTRLTNFASTSKVEEVSKCRFSIYVTLRGTAGHAETTCTTQGLSKLQAQELILRLNSVERGHLMTALHEYNSKIIKDEYEGKKEKIIKGQLAASKWRSKYGRPSKLPRLGDVDPTGSYCPFPEDWLKKKMAQSVPRPTSRDLLNISVANSIPFIGFGFLDNFFMLIFGDYIDLYLGSYFCLTTMGAAAMGNTISDILGIGSAFYVERLANQIGIRPPQLSPLQLDMHCSRNAANAGRVLGVTLGCILGMFPLILRKNKKEAVKEDVPEK